METEGLEFNEAVERLAAQAGVALLLAGHRERRQARRTPARAA